MNITLSITAATLALLCSDVVASPLDAGTVRRVVNDVGVASAGGAPRRVSEQAVIGANDHLRAGAQSRAELLFPDGTLARLGAETVLGFRRGTRELALDQGTLLLEVAGFHGGARIRTGALTAVCGAATVLIEHLPSRSLKIVVLEGDVRVAAAGFLGDSIILPPGKMLITTPDVKRIPDPVDVDLSTLVKTSALIDATAFSGRAAPLASLPRIEREIARQAGFIKGRRLIPTNLAIVGSGTSVVIPGPAAEEIAADAPMEKSPAAELGGSEAEIRNSAKIAAHRSVIQAVEAEIPLPKP